MHISEDRLTIKFCCISMSHFFIANEAAIYNLALENYKTKNPTRIIEINGFRFNYCPFCGKDIKGF